jgi:hypothetical protein
MLTQWPKGQLQSKQEQKEEIHKHTQIKDRNFLLKQ